jgi:hypothetical protein
MEIDKTDFHIPATTSTTTKEVSLARPTRSREKFAEGKVGFPDVRPYCAKNYGSPCMADPIPATRAGMHLV